MPPPGHAFIKQSRISHSLLARGSTARRTDRTAHCSNRLKRNVPCRCGYLKFTLLPSASVKAARALLPIGSLAKLRQPKQRIRTMSALKSQDGVGSPANGSKAGAEPKDPCNGHRSSSVSYQRSEVPAHSTHNSALNPNRAPGIWLR